MLYEKRLLSLKSIVFVVLKLWRHVQHVFVSFHPLVLMFYIKGQQLMTSVSESPQLDSRI